MRTALIKIASICMVATGFFPAKLLASIQCHIFIAEARKQLESEKAMKGERLEELQSELDSVRAKLENLKTQLATAHEDEIEAARQELVATQEFESALRAQLGDVVFREVVRELKDFRAEAIDRRPVSEGLIENHNLTPELAKQLRARLIRKRGYLDQDLPKLDTGRYHEALEQKLDLERALERERRGLEARVREIERLRNQSEDALIQAHLKKLYEEYSPEFVFRTAAALGYAEDQFIKPNTDLHTVITVSPRPQIGSLQQMANLDWAVRSGDLIQTPLTAQEIRGLSRSFDSDTVQGLSIEQIIEREVQKFAREGNLSELKKHLAASPISAYLRDDLGLNAFDYAAANGNLEVVEYLLSEDLLRAAGVTKETLLSHRTAAGRSAYSLSLLNDYPKVSEYLKAQGAKILAPDLAMILNEIGIIGYPFDGQLNADDRHLNPAAIYRQYHDLNRNPFVASGAKSTLFSALTSALEVGAISKAQLESWMFDISISGTSAWAIPIFIDAGADVNAKDKNGKTLLHHAVDFLNVEMVSTLKARGANLNLKYPDGATPLKTIRKRMTNEWGSMLYLRKAKEIETLLTPPSWRSRFSSWFGGGNSTAP